MSGNCKALWIKSIHFPFTISHISPKTIFPLQGASVSSVLTMVKPWKVKDSDRFCTDNCGDHCPYCSKKHQLHYGGPTLCGILTKPDGPFASCHATVNPEMYTANCVYDVCTNHGKKQRLSKMDVSGVFVPLQISCLGWSTNG